MRVLMMSYCTKINNIPIYAEKELSQKEANNVLDYVLHHKTEKEDIASVDVKKEDDEYHITIHYVQPDKIERLRRITGK
jgi:hypothetical protein